MDKIASFQVDHMKLDRGVYVSRVDASPKDPRNFVTTLDIRMVKPNCGYAISTGAMHTIEHLGATFLRNSDWADFIVYFGPMGCRTGFYLILWEEWTSEAILGLITDMVDFISRYEGEVPGATEEECGNYRDHDLLQARAYCSDFLHNVLTGIGEKNLVY